MEVGGKGDYIHLSLHYHLQNDSCIQMGRGESHFNVSLIVRDKVTRQRPQTTTSEGKEEPKWIQSEVPLLTSPTPYRQAKPAHHVPSWLLTTFIQRYSPPSSRLTVLACATLHK